MNENAYKCAVKHRVGFNEYCKILGKQPDLSCKKLVESFFKFYHKYVNPNKPMPKGKVDRKKQDIMVMGRRLHGSYGSAR